MLSKKTCAVCAAVMAFPQMTATAMATSLTPWACVVVTAQRTPMPMAFATTLDDCIGTHTMHAASATAQAPFTSAAVLTSPLVTATATATNSTPWACVVVTAQRTPMPMASVTTLTTALAHTTLAACATAQVRSTSADVLTSPLATVTATATNSTPWACVVVTAQLMRMATACATMLKSAVAPTLQRATTVQMPRRMTDPATSVLVPVPTITR